MNRSKERISWADWVKGVGILSVVLTHVTMYFPGADLYLNKVLYTYDIPLFSIWAGVSAALWPKQYQIERGNFYLKRLKKYMIPYLLFSLFNSAVKLGVLLISQNLTKKIVRDEALAFFVTGNGTVWYLVTLFIMEILFYETKKAKPIRYIIMASGCILPFLIQKVNDPFLLVLMRAILGFFYFMTGYLFWIQYTEYQDRLNDHKSLVTGIVLLIAGCIMAFFFPYQIEFFDGVFSNGLVAVPISLMFSFGIILCCHANREASNRSLSVLQYFGKESLLIMLVHPTILLLFTYPFGSWFVSLQGITAFFASMVLFALVVLLDIPVIYVINRWLPILKGEF